MREPITIKRYNREKKTIEDTEVLAYIYPKRMPGIAIHKSTETGSTWNITHINSGKIIVPNIRTKKDAVSIAEKLTELCDWTLSEKELVKMAKDDKGFINKINETAQAV